MPRLKLEKVAVEDSGAYKFKDAQPSIHHGYNLPAISKLIPDGTEKFLKNLFASIKPGGFLILTTPYHGYLKNMTLSVINQWDAYLMVGSVGGHIKFFSPKTLKIMLELSLIHI